MLEENTLGVTNVRAAKTSVRVRLSEHRILQDVLFLVLSSLVLGAALYWGPFYTFSTFDSVYLGGNRFDGAIYVWLIQERQGSLFAPSGGMLYPYSYTAMYSDSFILPAAIVSLCQFLMMSADRGVAVSPSLYNAILLSAILFAGNCLAFLAFRLSKRIELALLCGIIFVCLPYFVNQLGHPQLLGAFVFPAVYYCYRQGRASLRLRPRFAWFFLCGVVLLLSFGWSVYYTVFAIVLLGVLLCYDALHVERLVSYITTLFSALLPSLAALCYLSLPYLHVQERFGARSLRQVRPLSTGIEALFAPAYSNSFWGSWFGQAKDFENQNFPGGVFFLSLVLIAALGVRQRERGVSILAVVFATSVLMAYVWNGSPSMYALWYWVPALIAAVVFLRSRFESTAYFLSLASLFLVLSWGSPTSKGFLSPFAVLFSIVPGLSSIRAPGRFVIIFYVFAIAAIAAAFRSWCDSDLRGRQCPWWVSVCIVGLSILCIVESQPRYWYSPSTPPAPLRYQSLAKLVLENTDANDSRDVALRLPIESKGQGAEAYVGAQSESMLWLQTAAPRYLNGHSGISPKWNTLLPWRTRYFPSEKSLEVLSHIPELRWIVFDPRGQSAEHVREKIQAFSNSLIVHPSNDPQGIVLELVQQYPPGSHQLRVANAPGREQRIELELSVPTEIATQIRLTLDCGQSGGGLESARLSQRTPSTILSCSLPIAEDRVSARLIDLRIDTENTERPLVRLERFLALPRSD